MLLELHIKNFAIIEHQSITLTGGLNVLSGETGAGKSLVLHALQLILGARAKSRFLRKGTDGWEIEALFSLEDVPADIRESLPEIARGDELVVTRSMSQHGKGRVLINGRLGTLALLEEITTKLMNICSQNHQIRLLDPEFHLGLIDDYSGSASLLEQYREVYVKWNTLRCRISDLEERSEQNLLREAELQGMYDELSALAPFDGVRESLEDTISRLSNSERLIERCSELQNNCNADQGLFSLLAGLEADFHKLTELDPGLESLLPILRSGVSELEEFEREFSRYASMLEVDEEQLESLREELAEHARIERKYRKSGKALDALFEMVSAELESTQSVHNIDQLKAELVEIEQQLAEIAARLQKKRSTAARKLTKQVVAELAELNMPSASFEARFTKTDFGPQGDHRVEFLIETNRGSGLRALREIASGGELSRIMLILKKVLRDRSGVNVLIFDEVDTGISGGVARAVGEKLKSLAAESQVLCITHLPQVASLADSHLMVRKSLSKSVTISTISALSEEQRVEEIARMLAGYEITEATRESARELLSS